jgi:tetratricopeptide (TPR) repeat protein
MMPHAPACWTKSAGRMRSFPAIRGLLTVFAIAMPLWDVSAAEAPSSGLVLVHSNPCLMAKYGHGQPCQVPALPDTTDTLQIAEANLRRAKFFIDLDDLPQALRETDAALLLDRGNVAIRHLAARLAMSTGDYPRAERDIAEAIQQAPADADIAASHATLLELQQRPEEALGIYNAVLAEHPDHAFSRQARAKLLLTKGRPDQAVIDLNVLLSGDDPDSTLLSLRASAYLQMAKPELAIADYSKALAQRPRQLDLLMDRAVAYALADNVTAALSDYEKVLGPIGATPRYAIGGIELAKYRTQRAFLLVHQKHFMDAASEMAEALNAGGKSALLRTQILLRRNGFPQTPLDGRDSSELRQSLEACFGLNACFQKISDEL